jgi:hypothetical protein
VASASWSSREDLILVEQIFRWCSNIIDVQNIYVV